MNIKITDPSHEYFGRTFEGSCVYYDINHTGKSPDLFIIKTPEGERQILSTQIDMVYYQTQMIDQVINKLGANIGDNVIIIRSGSGSYNPQSFVFNLPHKITGIKPTGHVQFDYGAAEIFRPEVVKV